jgi:hypothetical protein
MGSVITFPVFRLPRFLRKKKPDVDFYELEMRAEYEIYLQLRALPHTHRMRVLNHVGELFMEMGEYKFEDVTPTNAVEVA